MNGPSRSQGLKVVLKLPKAQPANKSGESFRSAQNQLLGQTPQPFKKRKRVEEQRPAVQNWSQPAAAASGLPFSPSVSSPPERVPSTSFLLASEVRPW